MALMLVGLCESDMYKRRIRTTFSPPASQPESVRTVQCVIYTYILDTMVHRVRFHEYSYLCIALLRCNLHYEHMENIQTLRGIA